MPSCDICTALAPDGETLCDACKLDCADEYHLEWCPVEFAWYSAEVEPICTCGGPYPVDFPLAPYSEIP